MLLDEAGAGSSVAASAAPAACSSCFSSVDDASVVAVDGISLIRTSVSLKCASA